RYVGRRIGGEQGGPVTPKEKIKNQRTNAFYNGRTQKKIWGNSGLNPREPLINDPDNFRRIPFVKMVRSFDVPVGPARARRGGKLLGIFVKKFRFGATDDSEQWAANALRVGTAIVAIVLAVFVQMRARAENSRRGADV